ncbi:MAG: 4Fe-4S binding protein [Bacillota bacterium]
MSKTRVILNKKRTRLQSLTWIGLPLVVIGGWFYPLLGFLMFGCMIGAVGVAFFRGRAWCDWMCPRGSFFDLFLGKISPGRQIPSIFKSAYFRGFMVGLIFVVLGVQVYLAWGNPAGVGMAMVRVLTVTTVAGIVLALVYHPRNWCRICPMGTLANLVAGDKNPLTVNDSCVGCKVCSRVCPMQLEPYRYMSGGVMGDRDCIKCSTCVAACPKKALTFDDAPGDTCIDRGAA